MSNLNLISVASMAIPLPKHLTLRNQLEFAMHYVQQPENAQSVFWLFHEVTEDDRFRTALAAVLVAATPSERELIERSLQPIKALNSGVPILGDVEGLLPLMKMWVEA